MRAFVTRAQIQYRYDGRKIQPVGQILLLEDKEAERLNAGASPLVVRPSVTPLELGLNSANLVFKEDSGYIITKGGGWYVVCDAEFKVVTESVQGYENAKGALGGKSNKKDLDVTFDAGSE